MRNIVYYVAVSLDGFIAGDNDDIDGFIPGGSGIEQYLNDLKDFDTVIMGRKTYEFGYKFGLQPGQAPYPQMKNYVFSNTLHFENNSANLLITPPDISFIKKLKEDSGTDIYLCGGGEFAGWLLENELIDVLKIKLNPLVLGNGIRLFGSSHKKLLLRCIGQESYDAGLQIITYQVNYH